VLNLKYLYTHPEFSELITLVSKNKNLPVISVEKDYWVTFLLRELVNSKFNEEIVFKGGTCLSKAWKLIDRFSEDIDLLLIETEITKSTTQKGKRLKSLREFVKMLPGWELIQDNRSDLYGSFKYSYPLIIKKEFPVSISNSILLEPGYRGGVKPHIEKKQINSILGEELKGKLKDYDTEPFEINVLSLERIFAEKLFAITSLFNKGVLNSKTRHIYDTYKLIATEEIKTLANAPKKLDLILDDIS
jgi:predicted nucleotidyltransferase component of viral defense system